MVFINTFLKYNLLENKNTLINNIKIFPFSFYLKDFKQDIIKEEINKYNKLYDNNKINKDFGKDYWIVKDNYSNRGIGTIVCKTEDLYKINKKDIVIQKYLEKPHLINNKKVDIRLYLLIIPKIEFKDGKYQIAYKNNKILLNYYLNNLILFKNSFNEFNLTDTDLKTHLTNWFVQDRTLIVKNFIFIEDQILYKTNIKYKILLYISDPNIQKTIYESINNYPFFYQIVGIDMIITNNQDVYIVDTNTNANVHFDEIDNTYLMVACLQRIFRVIFKLKYNKKLKINKNLITYLEKLIKLI